MLSFYAFLVHKSRIVYGVRHTPIPIHAEAHDMQTIKPWYTHHQHAHMKLSIKLKRSDSQRMRSMAERIVDQILICTTVDMPRLWLRLKFCSVDYDFFFLLFFCGWFQLKCASILNLIFRFISILHSHMDSKWLNNDHAAITLAWQFVFGNLEFIYFLKFLEI